MNLRLPLHTVPSPLSSPHKGLLLDRYLLRDEKDEGWRKELETIVRVNSSHSAYKLAYTRWLELTSRWSHCLNKHGTIRGRMAIGLGIASVQEIGCRLHATYGVPVIPASSLKGALRARLCRETHHVEHARFLFGNDRETEEPRAGFAEVFDSWWVPDGNKSGLALDVVTVHHQDYYAEKAPPADTESPVPVSFLTVTGKFLFTIRAPNDSWKAFLEQLLVQTLSQDGIGAKRAAGYGRFKFQ